MTRLPANPLLSWETRKVERDRLAREARGTSLGWRDLAVLAWVAFWGGLAYLNGTIEAAVAACLLVLPTVAYALDSWFLFRRRYIRWKFDRLARRAGYVPR